MSLRFQKRKKILPGTSVNLSKASASVSSGVKGARLSLGRRGVRGSVGIPGTGISLTNLGIGRMGGFGAIVAAFVLLFVFVFKLVWIVIKVSFQITIWLGRGTLSALSAAYMAFQRLQGERQIAKKSRKVESQSRNGSKRKV